MAAIVEGPRNEDMQRCIELCLECYRVCIGTLRYCLTQGGPHAAEPHVRLLLDCIEICRTSADFMLRGSELHARTCAACAEVCARCADDCARFDDATMQRCVEVCRRCAEACRRMAADVVISRAA